MRNSFKRKSDTRKGLGAAEATKQIEPSDEPKHIVSIGNNVVSTFVNFLKQDYADKAGVISLVKQKVELDEGEGVLQEWLPMVTAIFDADKDFPVEFIPVVNETAYEVLVRAEMKERADKKVAAETAAAEAATRREVKMGYAEGDSAVALTGALAYLGVNPDDELEPSVAIEKLGSRPTVDTIENDGFDEDEIGYDGYSDGETGHSVGDGWYFDHQGYFGSTDSPAELLMKLQEKKRNYND